LPSRSQVHLQAQFLGLMTVGEHGGLQRANLDQSPPALARALRESALSLVLFFFFIASVVGQIGFGLDAYNEERLARGASSISLLTYLTTGHFVEALFENWESEFLQMGIFVWLSARLAQKGSAESKPLSGPARSEEDPRLHRHEPGAPWPVCRGGWVLWFYERSLAIAFGALFAGSLIFHAVGGHLLENEERLAQGLSPQSLFDFASSSQFWFESFQNWQSEFLSVLAIVTFTIFLRQRGSPQSKPVAASHSATGT
jgi:hypothetical protein